MLIVLGSDRALVNGKKIQIQYKPFVVIIREVKLSV